MPPLTNNPPARKIAAPHAGFGFLTAGLLLFTGLAAMTSLLVGPAPLSILDVALALLGSGDEVTRVIVWELRVPRTALALMIGATLAISGAALQGFVRNPLASPGLLGATNFAALGAVLTLYFGGTAGFTLALPLSAIAMAALSVAALITIAGRDSRILTLILAGLALSSLASALVALALNLAPSPFAIMEITFWLLGSLSDRSMDHLLLAGPFMVASWALLLYDRRALLGLTLGEDTARSLGVSVLAARLRIVLAVALGAGAAVAVAGVIGFVGLIVPHLMRPFTGYDPARLLIPSGIAGAGLLALADCLTRVVPGTAELKLGVLTAIVGVPFFLYLIFRERHGRPAFI